MQVLIINPILYTSETDIIPKVNSIKDTMIYSLCMGFIENGDEPVLAASMDYKPVADEEYPFEIVWFKSVLPKVFKPRCLPKFKDFRKYLKRQGAQFDYIISGEVFSLCTYDVSCICPNKLIIWHELGAHNNMLHKIPSKVWYNLVAKMAYRNIPLVPRSLVAREFISKYCNNVSDVIIDHGVDLNKFPATVEKDKYFVVVSQLIERKKIDKIIEAFAAFVLSQASGNYSTSGNRGQDVKDTRDRTDKTNELTGFGDYRLLIIGDGPLKGKLEELAKKLLKEAKISTVASNETSSETVASKEMSSETAASRIEFVGKLTHKELMPILSKAAGLLIHTTKDNSMVSIVESIACGTPVLTTSVPFNSTYIKKFNLGIVKDDWTFEDIEAMVVNNSEYVKNCIEYRQKLGTKYMAQQFDTLAKSIK